MDTVVFLLAELQLLRKIDLMDLCDFYNLSTGGTKKELIDRLDGFYRPKYKSTDIESPEMSVRVRRICESK